MGRHKEQPAPEQLEQVRDQLRAEIREARETLKDLRGAIKEARELAPELVGGLIEAEVTKGLEELGKTTKQAMRDSVARVITRFDELFDLITAQDRVTRRAGKPSIPELIEARGPAGSKEH